MERCRYPKEGDSQETERQNDIIYVESVSYEGWQTSEGVYYRSKQLLSQLRISNAVFRTPECLSQQHPLSWSAEGWRESFRDGVEGERRAKCWKKRVAMVENTAPSEVTALSEATALGPLAIMEDEGGEWTSA
uniref:Predicted protein n=1 Tax=Physcomitrium patens TaxID=3218 RepID=A9U1B9_PHYPA